MIRHLFKTGNSVVLSLPKEVLDDLGIDIGESVNLELDQENHRIIITRAEKPGNLRGVDPTFSHQVDEFIAQYRQALLELAE